MKRWAEIWSSFPSEHKKRFWQGFGSYILLCAAVLVWVSFNAKNTRDIWQGRIPSATAVIGTAPLGITPDIIPDTSKFPPDHIPDTTAPIPVVRSNAQTYDDGNTYVSIIISDMGLSSAMTEQALKELPKGVNLAFSPYAENLGMWLKKAALSSLETLVYMPMESATYPKDDPGPRSLSSRLSDQDNEDNLKWVLSQGGGSAGVINLMGSRFLTDRKRLSPVFEALSRKNSLFVEIPGAEKSEAPAIASQNGLPYLAVDMKIDDSTTEQDIRRQLDALEKMAKERGFAIGIADPYPLTFRILKSWSDGLKGRGILLAPLTKVWKNKPHNDGSSQPSQEQLRQP